MVMLNSEHKERHGKTIHRLVAEAFIDNSDKLPIVNHKDENKLNNHVDNLEWCSYKYNIDYSNVHEKLIEAISKTIYRYDKDWNLIDIYRSTGDAHRKTGYSRGNIWNACQHPNAIRYNSHWSYTPLV